MPCCALLRHFHHNLINFMHHSVLYIQYFFKNHDNIGLQIDFSWWSIHSLGSYALLAANESIISKKFLIIIIFQRLCDPNELCKCTACMVGRGGRGGGNKNAMTDVQHVLLWKDTTVPSSESFQISSTMNMALILIQHSAKLLYKHYENCFCIYT